MASAQVNQTKIKGAVNQKRKVVHHDSKSDLTLSEFKILITSLNNKSNGAEVRYVCFDFIRKVMDVNTIWLLISSLCVKWNTIGSTLA